MYTYAYILHYSPYVYIYIYILYIHTSTHLCVSVCLGITAVSKAFHRHGARHLAPMAARQSRTPQQRSRSVGGFIPDAPCMEYLPTLTL